MNAWPKRSEANGTSATLTITAYAHALMCGLHLHDPKLAADKQDKRSVIPLDPGDFDQWLEGTVEQARGLMRLAPTEMYDAGPVAA